MGLEKKRNLRQIEFVFADGKLLPDCHCLYHNLVEEDGKVIAKTNERENVSNKAALKLIIDAPVFIEGK